MEGRVVPNSLEAEYGILGTMIEYPEVRGIAFDKLTGNDFFDKGNGLIFETMREMETEGVSIELLSLAEKLKSKGILDQVGGSAFIAELSLKSGSSLTIDYLINIVQSKSVMRKLITYSRRVYDRAFLPDGELTEVIDMAQSELYDIIEGKDSNFPVKIDEVLTETFKILDERTRKKGAITGLTTGYSDLDYKLSGLQRKDLIIVAARPSMGKTAFAVNMAVNASRNTGARVALFSLEMSKVQLTMRMLAFTGQIEMNKLMNGNIEDEDWHSLFEAADVLGQSNIYIDDTPAITLSSLKSKCRNLMGNGGLDLVVIDYLQLMTGEGRQENRQQEISKISRGLKTMAKEVDCPVIAISQLSRAPDARSDRRPVLSDLRESGAIEQDADVVMLLYRDDYYNPDTEDKGITEIIVAKHRNGPVGTVNLLYRHEFTRFVSLARNIPDGGF